MIINKSSPGLLHNVLHLIRLYNNHRTQVLFLWLFVGGILIGPLEMPQTQCLWRNFFLLMSLLHVWFIDYQLLKLLTKQSSSLFSKKWIVIYRCQGIRQFTVVVVQTLCFSATEIKKKNTADEEHITSRIPGIVYIWNSMYKCKLSV